MLRRPRMRPMARQLGRQRLFQSSSGENYAYCRQVSPVSACMRQGACIHLCPAFCQRWFDCSHAAHSDVSLYAAVAVGVACTGIGEHPAAPLQIERVPVCRNALLSPGMARTHQPAFPSGLLSRRYLLDSRCSSPTQLFSSPPELFFAFCKRREAQKPQRRLVFPVLTCRYSMLTQLHTHEHTHTHTHTHTNTHTYAHARKPMYTYICICTHARTHERTHARTHT